ncbi:hypothetical protein KNE206_71140 [Kitasatospora sp. NE20-6]|uniref:hypothetical protein n=1 Tax=Kitasatospora sp. NE20-6 TaxID=2859066 RepID=UPI0034DBACE4
MARIVVMLEIEELDAARDLGGGEHPTPGRAALVVHAAGPAADPSRPAPRTFCGLETAGLQRDPAQPDDADGEWYPARWAQRVCDDCAAAVHHLTAH